MQKRGLQAETFDQSEKLESTRGFELCPLEKWVILNFETKGLRLSPIQSQKMNLWSSHLPLKELDVCQISQEELVKTKMSVENHVWPVTLLS